MNIPWMNSYRTIAFGMCVKEKFCFIYLQIPNGKWVLILLAVRMNVDISSHFLAVVD